MNNSKLIKIQRHESRISNLLNEFIRKEVYNETLKFATIMYVRLSNDYSAIKVFIDCADRTKIDGLVKKLNQSASLFKHHIAHKLDFRRAPSVLFLKDETVDRAQEIEDILKDLNQQKE